MTTGRESGRLGKTRQKGLLVMIRVLARIAVLAALAAVCAAQWGCLSANYNPDPVREAKQQDIIHFIQSSSEGRGYY